MHKGGVIRVVVEVCEDGRIAPGVLFVEIVDSLVESTLGFLETCEESVHGVFVIHFFEGGRREEEVRGDTTIKSCVGGEGFGVEGGAKRGYTLGAKGGHGVVVVGFREGGD